MAENKTFLTSSTKKVKSTLQLFEYNVNCLISKGVEESDEDCLSQLFSKNNSEKSEIKKRETGISQINEVKQILNFDQEKEDKNQLFKKINKKFAAFLLILFIGLAVFTIILNITEEDKLFKIKQLHLPKSKLQANFPMQSTNRSLIQDDALLSSFNQKFIEKLLNNNSNNQ